MLILGIETSCDETAAAVVEDGRVIRSSIVSSQIDLHAQYGGVVPEVASRAHVDLVVPVVADALGEAGLELRDLDAVAATHGPGLAGALLVGVSAAKALALVGDLPYVGVNHMEAHLYAGWLEEPNLTTPLAVLLVSGGHTMVVAVDAPGSYRVLGETVDDAAGEAFDKVARFLGLGYPGGPVIDRLARDGRADAIPFPRPWPAASTRRSPGSRLRWCSTCGPIPMRRSPTSRRRSRKRWWTSWWRSWALRPTPSTRPPS